MSASEPGAASVSLVDCDLWVQKASYQLIAPYLASSWREWLRIDEPPPAVIGYRPALPESEYYLEGPALLAAAETESWAGDAIAYLDANQLGAAILNPGAATGVAGLANPLLAAAVARAVNDWTVEEWLPVDPRLLGSIVVALRDPQRAAAEIRRLAANERMAQILVAYPPKLFGDRHFRPVFDAACEVGLPINVQAGGAFSGQNGGLGPVGHPASAFEAMLGAQYTAQPHLVNMLVSGLFDRYPDLAVVLNGFGVAWVPTLLWRMDMEYRAGRVAPPSTLTALPSSTLERNVRFTTVDLELSPNPADLVSLLGSIAAENLLLLGSGPLRGGDAGDLGGFGVLPDAWKQRAGQSAAALYPAVARVSV